MNWILLLVLIPIVVLGVVFAYFIMPRTPEYKPPTTTTTTRGTIKTTFTTTQTRMVETTTSTYSPCSLFKGECKTVCSQDDDILQASCGAKNRICCRSRKILTTTTTTTEIPGIVPT